MTSWFPTDDSVVSHWWHRVLLCSFQVSSQEQVLEPGLDNPASLCLVVEAVNIQSGQSESFLGSVHGLREKKNDLSWYGEIMAGQGCQPCRGEPSERDACTEHLPCVLHHLTGFVCTNSFNSHNKPIGNPIVVPFYKWERLREAKELVQSHIASKWQNQIVLFQSHCLKPFALWTYKATRKGKQR